MYPAYPIFMNTEFKKPRIRIADPRFCRCACRCCRSLKSENCSENLSIKSHHVKFKKQKFTPGVSLEWLLLYAHSIFIIILGGSLTALSIWSFVRKMAVYTYFMEIKLDPSFFGIPAGLFGLCSVVFAVLLRSSNNFKYILWFLVLQILGICLAFTGLGTGTYYKLDFSNETLRLGATIPKETLNTTLRELLALKIGDNGNQTALDNVHRKFKCCGVEDVSEFGGEVPQSCCVKNDCDTCGHYPTGCLRNIREDVAWQMQITSSLCQLFLLMFFFNSAIVGSVYVSNRSTRKANLLASRNS